MQRGCCEKPCSADAVSSRKLYDLMLLLMPVITPYGRLTGVFSACYVLQLRYVCN
jgi:hypothetical protein